MKERLKKTSTKVILITISILCSIVMILALVLAGAYPMSEHTLFEKEHASYEDTEDFAGELYGLTDTIRRLSENPYFHADGSYDPETRVDLYDFIYGEHAIIDCGINYDFANKAPLTYRLGDLMQWAEKIWSEGLTEGNQKIVVCKKTDGYDYFTYEDFKSKILNNEFLFSITSTNTDIRTEDLLLGLYDEIYVNETLLSQEGDFKGIQDKDGKLLYTDCWSYDGNRIYELYKPLEFDSLIDYVNHTKSWNGNLSNAYELLSECLLNIDSIKNTFDMFSSYYHKENSNLAYFLADPAGKTIYTNNDAWKNYQDPKDVDRYIKEIVSRTDSVKYLIFQNDGSTLTNIQTISENPAFQDSPISGKILAITVDTTYPVADTFSNLHHFYEFYRPLTRYMIIGAIAGSILLLICLVLLTMGAGRQIQDNDLHLMKWDLWYTELSAAAVFFFWMLTAGLFYAGLEMDSGLYNIIYHEGFHHMMLEANPNLPLYMILYGLLAAYTMIMFLIGYLSLVRRIKAGILWKNSILKRVWNGSLLVIRNLNILWKLVIVSILYLFLLILAVTDPFTPLVTLPFIGAIAIIVYLLRFCLGQKKLVAEIDRIAGGDVDHQIDEAGLTDLQKTQAQSINRIREGLSIAIEKNLKSERMKTELITNVSHDLKTPLTSIINYVDLLKKEDLQNENAKKYLDVLEKKSHQLKNLTEDVIEASKASSGNITLEKMNLDVTELLNQCSGEYMEKFYDKHLNLIENYPESPVIIYADGRRLWRIFSNLYSNVAKYALPGSRVYADLLVAEKRMTFTLKNISQSALNISADELTERFIRGDAARTTEGSGLGLSIAKSLTELQGGTFDIYLDGDLFKVTITFPVV